MQDADMGRHGHGLDLVVRHIEEGRPGIRLDALQLHAQVGPQFRVERTQRLVHQVDLGRADKRAADRHPLHLPA